MYTHMCVCVCLCTHTCARVQWGRWGNAGDKHAKENKYHGVRLQEASSLGIKLISFGGLVLCGSEPFRAQNQLF